MQKLAEEKKAEALKAMGGMPQELDLKRHGPDGYGHCRDGRSMPGNTTMPRQHPKQVGSPSFLASFSSFNVDKIIAKVEETSHFWSHVSCYRELTIFLTIY